MSMTTKQGETPNQTEPKAGETPNNQQASQQAKQTLQEWLASQPEEIHELVESHVSGLSSALKSERDRAKNFEKQIKALTAKAEEGSATRAELEKLAASLTKETQKAKFLETAATSGVSDLALAWKAVQDSEFIDEAGAVDFQALKEKHPGLFRDTTKPQIPTANAGSGLNTPAKKLTGNAVMNQMIRKAIGR